MFLVWVVFELVVWGIIYLVVVLRVVVMFIVVVLGYESFFILVFIRDGVIRFVLEVSVVRLRLVYSIGVWGG